MPNKLASPWREFLAELDEALGEPFTLHCIGGFAVVAGYGLQRSTNDLDYLALLPSGGMKEIQRLGGPGSALAKKHSVHLRYSAVASMPESYEDRLTELFAGSFKHLHLLVPDPYDLALSKLTRNKDKDREDVKYLARTRNLDPEILRKRYIEELRTPGLLIGPHEQHDTTLDLWLNAYFQKRGS